jgi:aminoglycoside phosphotransferase (APT) family kinase protein
MIKSLSVMGILICFSAIASPKFLTQHDAPAIQEVLKNEAPDLVIHSLKLVSTGGDNLIADVNGEWIFRFPKKEVLIAALERENRLLNRIRPKITLPTPLYEYIGRNTMFVGYRKIQGVELNEALYTSLTLEERQNIAEDLAHFLNELHHCITPEEALKMGCDFYTSPMNTINETKIHTLPPAIKNMVLEALSFAKKNPIKPHNIVLKHNDLHGDNFCLDLNTHKINGVFDFTDAAIGDYSGEFAKLFNVHPGLVYRTAFAYIKLNGKENPIKAAAADHILRRTESYWKTKENGDANREIRMLHTLHHFIPIWNEIFKNGFYQS